MYTIIMACTNYQYVVIYTISYLMYYLSLFSAVTCYNVHLWLILLNLIYKLLIIATSKRHVRIKLNICKQLCVWLYYGDCSLVVPEIHWNCIFWDLILKNFLGGMLPDPLECSIEHAHVILNPLYFNSTLIQLQWPDHIENPSDAPAMDRWS